MVQETTDSQNQAVTSLKAQAAGSHWEVTGQECDINVMSLNCGMFLNGRGMFIVTCSLLMADF